MPSPATKIDRPAPRHVARTADPALDQPTDAMRVQRNVGNSRVPQLVSGVLDSAAANPGVELPHSTRMDMERTLGKDLGAVRIHTDQQAASAADALGARAFAAGTDIYFGAGRFSPRSDDGRELLAHEL